MAGVELRQVEALDARKATFNRYGVAWEALVTDDGRETEVRLRAEGGGDYRLALALPSGATADPEDLAFALARPEVAFLMGDIAEDEDLEGFDCGEYEADGLAGGKVTMASGGTFEVRYGDGGPADILEVVGDLAEGLRAMRDARG